MKLLAFNGYFLLPDDFELDLNNALFDLTEYRKKKGYTGLKTGLVKKEITTEKQSWAEFLKVVRESDNKFVGSLGMYEVDFEKGTTTFIEE
ncbi:MAG: hypothetical protein WC679_02295 [Bacteroidales bacterium]|jgi:hypothetical protein